MDVLLGFRDDGFYLLDEPEAALSPARQLAALSAIDTLVRNGSQFIIATHSPILLAYPNAKILCFDGSGVTEVAYTDTEHYAITRDFLNNYERRLQQLFDDAE
jgi:predicted ATPase